MFKSDNTTFNVIKLLAPGFLALFVISSIVDIGETREINLLFFAFVLTILCWILAYPTVWLFARATGRIVVCDLGNAPFVGYVVFLSVVGVNTVD
jgi:bacteriorhodopsin